MTTSSQQVPRGESQSFFNVLWVSIQFLLAGREYR